MANSTRDWDDDYLTRAWNLPKESVHVPASNNASGSNAVATVKEQKEKKDPTLAQTIWSRFAEHQRKNKGYKDAPKTPPAPAMRPEDEPGNTLCTFFAAGTCAAGNTCRFRHVKPEQPAVDFFVDLLRRFQGSEGNITVQDILYSLALELEDCDGYFDLEDFDEVAQIYGEKNAELLFELVEHIPAEQKDKGHTAILEEIIGEFVALRNTKPEQNDTEDNVDNSESPKENPEEADKKDKDTTNCPQGIHAKEFQEHFYDFLKRKLESFAGPDALAEMEERKKNPQPKKLQLFAPFQPFQPTPTFTAATITATKQDDETLEGISFPPLTMDTFSPSPNASTASNPTEPTSVQAKKKKKKKKKQQAEALHPLFFNKSNAPPASASGSSFAPSFSTGPTAYSTPAPDAGEEDEFVEESQKWVEKALADRSALIEAALLTGLASSEDAAEIALLYAEREISSDIECAICYETVLTSSKSRFGLLTGCSHPFCLSCIREWRGRIDLPKHTVRSCPICRQPSHFVIPSDRFITDHTRKALITSEYNTNQSKIPCRNFDYGRGVCPFGSSCFYAHLNLDGTEYRHGGYTFVTDEDGNFVNMKDVLSVGLDRRFRDLFSASGGGGQDADDDDSVPKKPGQKGKTV